MDKVGYPRGLVRYATQSSMESASGSALAGAWQQVRASLMRPRILVYGGLLLVVTIALLISLALRSPFKVDVVRDRATLSRIVEGGKLENVYRLQIMNATEEVQQYRIKARGIEGLMIEDNSPVAIDSAQSRWVPLRVRIPYGSAKPGSVPIVFDIESVAGDKVIAVVSEKSVFLVPR
jgi:polyferredoxin